VDPFPFRVCLLRAGAQLWWLAFGVGSNCIFEYSKMVSAAIATTPSNFSKESQGDPSRNSSSLVWLRAKVLLGGVARRPLPLS
jgi:hypothetical protein